MALRVASGTYTGNSTDNRDITVSPSFIIKAVLIKSDSTDGGAILSVSGMGDGARRLNVEGAVFSTNYVQSMGTGTFQIGNNVAVNNSAQTYYYVALGGDDADIVASTYTGDGVDNRQITTNFQPAMVIILRNAVENVYARFGGIAGDNCLSFAASGGMPGADIIQSFNSTGFVIGASGVNTGGATYYYLAIKEITTQSYTSSYTGDGTDNRNITAPNFQPNFVLIKSPNLDGRFSTSSLPSGDTARFDINPNGVDMIQALNATGFQIGTNASVNQNTLTYYYYAVTDTQPASGNAMFMGANF